MFKNHFPVPLYGEPLLYSLYLALLSIAIFGSRVFRSLLQGRVHPTRNVTSNAHEDQDDSGLYSEESERRRALLIFSIKKSVREMGSVTFVLKSLRALSCIALVVITVAASITLEDSSKDWSAHDVDNGQWRHTNSAYTSILAILSIVIVSTRRIAITRHLNTLLLFDFGVYAYRNIWPLATFTLTPEDGAAGWFTWSRVIISSFVAVWLPSVTPHDYIPVDLNNPASPVPEQTASPLSLMTFAFIDPIVSLASKVSHLSYEKLPPLADYDHSEYLRGITLPILDPLRTSAQYHILWSLLNHFRGRLLFNCVMLSLNVLFLYTSPFAINRLLTYIESNGADALVRPWVWIIALFLSPTLGSICMQMNLYVTNHILVQMEAILTQLIFEHSLRVRMTESDASATDTSSLSPSNSPPATQSSQKDPVSSNLVGKINNLMSTDLHNITEGRDLLFLFLYVPLQLIVCVVFLYDVLGWSALVGTSLVVVTFSIPGKVAQLMNGVAVEQAKQTDGRVQTITETLSVIRMVKLFGWESKAAERVSAKRENELASIMKKNLLALGLRLILNFLMPIMIMVSTFGIYTLVMKQPLTAAKVFSSMAVFDSFRMAVHLGFTFLPIAINANVSLNRVNDYLKNTILLDHFSQGDTQSPDTSSNFLAPTHDPDVIGFHNATFTWSSSSRVTPVATPSRKRFRLQIDGDLIFHRGEINLILGPTGSGKTALLLALLGELHFCSTNLDSWYNLPRQGGIAYAAQEAWVQNDTVKNNILFGQPYDKERYSQVLSQCALDQDLTMFENGDETEVGEKGLTLSGGQKARVSLARAIYSVAEIILLDDILSALDVHTTQWIVDKCLKGDLVDGRTVILVSHNISITSPIASFVVSLGLGGHIASQGSMSDALTQNKALLAEISQEEALIQDPITDRVDDSDGAKEKPNGRLSSPEEIAEGHIGIAALKLYVKSLGGSFFWVVFMATMSVTHFLYVAQTWFLGFWARQYEEHTPEQVRVPMYLAGYATISLCMLVIYSIGYSAYVFGSIRASRSIHERLTRSIMGTTLRFLDTTPAGRIVARFTQDIRAVDGNIAMSLQALIEGALALSMRFSVIVYMSPLFLIPALVIVILGGWLGNTYMAAQLSVKREMSNARSPVFSLFGGAIEGIASIRAYGAQTMFTAEALKRIDKYSRPARTFYSLNRWISIRGDAVGGVLASGLAAYLVYWRTDMTASDIGFQLNLAIWVALLLLWWIRTLNEFEVLGNSLERIQDYLTIDQEPVSTESGKPPAYWPSSGALTIEKLSARYSEDGPDVLHELSFEISSGERVGVVGRTGSGKSSLTLSLLRMIPTDGRVLYDGIDANKLNLDAVRGNITIIPQQPELLSGTIRQNLDPFSQYEDAILNDALRSAGLFSLQKNIPVEEQINLDSTVSSSGGNFSLGQRQILALARALVRRSKVLILDEATASLDHETDTLVQQSMRTEFKDCTLIIVAHRLHTIMRSDKILVLDAGRLVEFDTPLHLLQKKSGVFKALVEESADRDILLKLAADASS